MKKQFPTIVEHGRVLNGALWSLPGDRCGAFFIRRPPVGPTFKVIVGDGLGWDHVSVSLRKRIPTWDEMAWIKSLFFEPEECALEYHPPASSYVNTCGQCLHLWRPQNEPIPMPPVGMV